MPSRVGLTAGVGLVALLAACSGDDQSPKVTVAVTPASQTRFLGESQQFAATINGAPAGSGQIGWSSTNPAVAPVDPASGLATARAVGTARIRAAAGSEYAEGEFIVVPQPAPAAGRGALLFPPARR